MEHDPAVIAGVSLAIETVIAKAVELSPGTQSPLEATAPADHRDSLHTTRIENVR